MIDERDPETRVGYAIKRAQHAQRTAVDNALRDLGLTAPQWGTLMFLDRHADLSNAGLARCSDCTPQTMNAIVHHLERAGLVERHPHPTHGTVLPARLTPAGRDLLHAGEARVNALEAKMLAPLSREERAQLIDLLNRYVDALHAEPVVRDDAELPAVLS